MRIFVSVIILFISSLLYAQNELDTEFQEYISDFRNFDMQKLANKEFKHSLARLSIKDLPSYRRDTCFVIVKRDLDFGVSESIYRVVLNYAAEDNSLRQNNYRLHVLEYNDSIIGIISDNKYLRKTDTYFAEDKMKWYIDQHDSFYQTLTDKDDLVEELTENRIYGYQCGNAPVIRDVPEKYGYKFNESKHLPVFRKWLRSYNPELQTYGVDAINTVNKLPGLTLSERDKRKAADDLKLIRHIKKRNSIINTCSGSFVGIYERAFINSESD